MIRLNYHIILVIFLISICSCRNTNDWRKPNEANRNTVDIEYEYKTIAGEELTVRVPNDNVEFVLLRSSLSKKIYDAFSNVLHIPGQDLEHAGYFELLFYGLDGIVEEGSIKVLPGEAHGKIASYIGPKTIWPKGIQKAMHLNIPRDSFHNAMLNEELVSLSAKYPDGSIRKKELEVNKLHVSNVFIGEDKSSKIYVGTKKGSSAGPEQEVEVVAFWPHQIYVELIEHFPFADRRQRLRLHTNQMSDRFGNLIADGTNVVFEIMNDQGALSLHKAFTIDGKASISIRNPMKPTNWTIKACVGGVVCSESIEVNFDSNIKSFDLYFDKLSREINIGPVIASLSNLVPDGTEVNLNFQGTSNEINKTIELEDGKAVCDLSLFPPGEYDVKVTISDKLKTMKIKL